MESASYAPLRRWKTKAILSASPSTLPSVYTTASVLAEQSPFSIILETKLPPGRNWMVVAKLQYRICTARLIALFFTIRSNAGKRNVKGHYFLPADIFNNISPLPFYLRFTG